MGDYVIELNKLGCKVGYRDLLKDINWKVKKGERWVIFGMNGSGKTTLLTIISGFKHYTEGKVVVLGDSFSNDNILKIRKKIGLVSASFFDKYYSKESALHIVLSGKSGTLGLDYGITLEHVRLAKALLTDLKLGDSINKPFDMFSKGERQNILIARALINSPDILILDEPCTGLDVYNRSYLFSTIEKLSQKKDLTIVYVTHYVEEILPLFDKVLLLKYGRIFMKGEKREVLNEKIISDLLGHRVKLEEYHGRYTLQVNADSVLTKLLE